MTRKPAIIPKCGDKFGHWTVLKSEPKVKNGRKFFTCECSCGTVRDVVTHRLQARTFCSFARHTPNIKHGMSRVKGEDGRTVRDKQTPEYMAWRNMLKRCYNPNTPGYERWGGRGIEVCDRWRNSFENFLKDMGPRPTPKHSLERSNNSLNYTLKNCKWAVKIIQQNNMRSNHYLEYKGKRLTVAQWAVEIGVAYSVLSSRIKYGWSIQRMLTTPVKSR